MSISSIGSNFTSLWTPSTAAPAPAAPAAESSWAIDLVDLNAPKPAPTPAPAPVPAPTPAPPKPAPPKPDPNETLAAKVYQRLMSRKPDAKTLARYSKEAKQLRNKGKEGAEIRKAIAADIKDSREYRTANIDDEIRPIYRKLLKDKPSAKELAPFERLAKRELKAGDSFREALGDVRKKLKSSEAYKKLHPKKITDRSKIYMAQPNGWTCGPTSLTMALKALGKRPLGSKTLNEMIRLTGTSSSVGVPGNASLLANAAIKVGCKAKYQASASPSNVRRALKEGHAVVLNGSLGTGGHFIYVAGIAKDGRFIIADPWRSSLTRMTDAELNHFANTYSNPRGFAEIWT